MGGHEVIEADAHVLLVVAGADQRDGDVDARLVDEQAQREVPCSHPPRKDAFSCAAMSTVRMCPPLAVQLCFKTRSSTREEQIRRTSHLWLAARGSTVGKRLPTALGDAAASDTVLHGELRKLCWQGVDQHGAVLRSADDLRVHVDSVRRVVWHLGVVRKAPCCVGEPVPEALAVVALLDRQRGEAGLLQGAAEAVVATVVAATAVGDLQMYIPSRGR